MKERQSDLPSVAPRGVAGVRCQHETVNEMEPSQRLDARAECGINDV